MFVDLLDTEPENQRFRERLGALDQINEGFIRDAGAARPPVVDQGEDIDEISFGQRKKRKKRSRKSRKSCRESSPISRSCQPLEIEDSPNATDPCFTAVDPSTPEGFDLEERLAEAGVFAKYGLVDKAISHLEDVVLFCPNEIEPRRRLAQLYAEHGDKNAAIAMASPIVERHRADGTLDQLGTLLASIPELSRCASAHGPRGHH